MNRKHHPHLFLLTLIALLVLLLTACGADDVVDEPAAEPGEPEEPAEEPADDADEPEPDTDAPAADEAALELWPEMSPSADAAEVDTSQFATDDDALVIGYADFGPVNSWRVQATASAEMVAEELGVELIVTDAGGDATKQISDVEDLLARGVDALLVSPVAPEPLAPVVERAHDAGIPVIVWASDVDTDQVTAKVIADDFFFGQAGGEKLVDDLGGEGNVVMLRGIAGNTVEQLRYDGAISAFEGTDIEVIAEEYGDWAFDQGKAITETFIAAHPQIDGVWASGAAMTRGAIQAFQEAGMDLPPMSGEHLNGFLKEWEDLGLDSSGPVFPTWQGPESVKLAVRALRGLPIHDDYLLQPEPILDAEDAVLRDVSDDYWVEGYLTEEEILEIFPN